MQECLSELKDEKINIPHVDDTDAWADIVSEWDNVWKREGEFARGYRLSKCHVRNGWLHLQYREAK